MTSTPTLCRKEGTNRLLALAVALADGLQQSGLSADRQTSIASSGLVGECPLCRMRISGKDLIEIASVTDDGEGLSSKAQRLRSGYCARTGCDSRFYDLEFIPQPDLDWSEITDRSDRINSDSLRLAESDDSSIADGVVKAQNRFRRLVGVRVLLPLVLFIAVLLARQWYRGGRIPFIREPETFQIDPLPAGEHDWSLGPPEGDLH